MSKLFGTPTTAGKILPIASAFLLLLNYANNTNLQNQICYSVTSDVKRQMSNVQITVYNALGKEIFTIVNEQKQPGSYELSFDGSNFASGIYFYKLKIEGKIISVKRMVLLK